MKRLAEIIWLFLAYLLILVFMVGVWAVIALIAIALI